METRNVKIASTQLVRRCFWINCEGPGWGQGFCGRLQDIEKILDVFDVESWEQLRGLHCRIVTDHTKIHKIGHILEDRWFSTP